MTDVAAEAGNIVMTTDDDADAAKGGGDEAAGTTSAGGIDGGGGGSKTTEIPRPYTWWWHPKRGLIDALVSALVSKWLIKLDQMADTSTTDSTPSELLRSVRAYSNESKMSVSLTKSYVQAWAKRASHSKNDGIVEMIHELPRPSVQSVVSEWNLNKDNTTDATAKQMSSIRYPPESSSIPMHFFFPSSLLSPETKKNQTDDKRTDNGFIPLSATDANLSELFEVINREKIPLICYLHGGGMVLGSVYSNPVGMIVDMFAAVNKKTSSACRPVVCVSIDYSLAPETTFPTAPLELLSVVSYLFQHVSEMHLVGESAGANLVTVATMESIRRYHVDASQNKRIASSLILCPFVNPAADSESYYMNSQDPFVPPKWLRWCWQCYLQLDAPPPVPEPKEGEEHTWEEILSQGSNQRAWKASGWKGTFWERLINPTVRLPADAMWSGTSAKPPKILVVTNEADPLHDEGMELVTKLQTDCHMTLESPYLTYMQHEGSHSFGTLLFGGQNKINMLQQWHKILFPGTSTK